MILNVLFVAIFYLMVKGVCFTVNSSENIRFNIPKIFEKFSIFGVAFLSQVLFF